MPMIFISPYKTSHLSAPSWGIQSPSSNEWIYLLCYWGSRDQTY